jgi:hypothetical protein
VVKTVAGTDLDRGTGSPFCGWRSWRRPSSGLAASSRRSSRSRCRQSTRRSRDGSGARGQIDDYLDHPATAGDVFSVIEVADSSLAIDLGPKLTAYAAAVTKTAHPDGGC